MKKAKFQKYNLFIKINPLFSCGFFALLLTTEAKSCAGLRDTFHPTSRKVRAGQSNWYPTETRMGRSLCSGCSSYYYSLVPSL